MVFSRSIHVARDGERLGKFSLARVPELAQSGFLKPDDDFWEHGMSDWRPLHELPELRSLGTDPEAWKRDAKSVVADAAGLLARGTARLAESARHFASEGLDCPPAAVDRLLTDFQSQLRERAQELVKSKPFLASTAALDNEEMMERAFSSLYDSLPAAIAHSVPERDFVDFCLRRRRELINPNPGETAPASSGRPEHFRLSHLRLLVSDFATELSFYREKLGLQVRFLQEGVYAELDTGATILSLFQRDFMAEALHTTAPHEASLPLQRPVTVLSVDDVDAAYVRLTEKGVEFLEGPTDRWHWGVRTIHLQDPEGNLIEINSPRAAR
ncbi:MAG: VOC family protein [Verrucomicrobia bacterium]|nr:VOC family protein [Verrucomicrobiota bacterium]